MILVFRFFCLMAMRYLLTVKTLLRNILLFRAFFRDDYEILTYYQNVMMHI